MNSSLPKSKINLTNGMDFCYNIKMLVKFDLKRVLSNSQNVTQIIRNILKYPGNSFLINYTDLAKQYRKYKSIDVLNYIIMASYRDYRRALNTKDYSLDWNHVSLSKKQLDLNKLIWHKNGRIFFRFEEESTLRRGIEMAIKFSKLEGSAKKSDVKYMTLPEGESVFRMVGDVLPRYVYWLKNGKATAAFECLSFNRDLEKFTNIEKDWVPELVEQYQGTPRKETKCAWAYVVQVIDRRDNTLKVLNLKKKMFETIKSLAEEFGDPTDPETGYNIIVDRKKTGPANYNVTYEVKQVKMMKERGNAMPEGDAEIIANLKEIEKLIPRPTPEEQKALLDAFLSAQVEEEAGEDKEAISELD